MKGKLFLTIMAVTSVTAISAQRLPYQNAALPVEHRVNDLMQRLKVKEKAQLMMNASPAIERLGIPQFDWWSEALHGVGRNGLSTVFPSCIGMACSFDDTLIERIYTAISDEARAKNTAQRQQGKAIERYQGLSFWTPNINIFRDPRWGRGQETYGEDPFLTAQMGLRVVRGLQGPASKYRKLLACAKHFAVHSGPEKTRHHFNIENLPQRDLWETYLTAFKTLVQQGDVQEVMCAYQRFEGEPCCGSNKLLQQILRQEWDYQGLVVSDCWAVSDFWQPGHHETSKDATEASAKAVLSGTDVECGSDYRFLPEAVSRGSISEKQIDASLRRLLMARFELGNFDADSLVEWTRIPLSVVSCQAHRDLARQMGREQMVLLKNNGILPLKPINDQAHRIMVMGPNAADSTMLWGIYFGSPAHTVTPLEGIQARLGQVDYLPACDFTSKTTAFGDILRATEQAETIIFIGGISPNLEKEEEAVHVPGFDGGDRTTIELPQVQRDLLKVLHEAGKKIVFVNCSGSAVALTPETETCDAIIQAWYAGEQGGHALADVLFGDYNPSGKLSVTFYKDDSQLPPFDDYRMQGRTYRYFHGEPLFPFGYGLSYTTFAVSHPTLQRLTDGSIQVNIKVKNTGKREGTEIIQVYLRRPDDPDGPVKTLRGYARVTLKTGEQQTVTIPLPLERFEWWDKDTNTMRVLPGTYDLLVGTSSAEHDLQRISIQL